MGGGKRFKDLCRGRSSSDTGEVYPKQAHATTPEIYQLETAVTRDLTLQGAIRHS